MQENFAIKAKRAIRRVAAISVGAAMLGATLSGALAADYTLADYPKPFDGSDAAVIVGNSADDAAAADIAAGLPVKAVSSAGKKAVGEISANVPLGMGIANSTSVGFDWEIKKNQIASFQKGKLNFQGKDYDAHDELILSKNTPNTATALSSRTAVQTDYEDNVFMEVSGREKIGYYYLFDDAINVSKATSSQPLELKFLGKTLKITNVDSTDTTKFTAYLTNEFFMNVGDTVTVDGKKVKLEDVSSTGSVMVTVDGVKNTVSSTSKVVNGIEIAVDQTFYDSNNKQDRAASLFVGKNAQDTYKDGDAFIGEDENNPQWLWDTSALAVSASNSVATSNGTIGSITGPRLGILNDFLKQSASQNPPGVGECLDLPNNFASICLDSLTVPAEDYVTMTIDLDKSEDISRSGQNTTATAVNVIRFEAGTNQNFVIKANSLSHTYNATTDKRTNRIWLTPGNGASGVPYNSTQPSLAVYYFDSDKNPQMQYAGSISIAMTDAAAYTPDKQVFLMDFGSTKDANVNVSVGSANTSTTNGTFNIYVENRADSTNDFSNGEDIIRTNWTAASATGNINSLGATQSTEEETELSWGTTGAVGNAIGKKDVNLRTRYGIVIKDPKANGANDKVVLAIPSDIVKAKVLIKGAVVAESAGSASSSTTMNAKDVTDLTQYNAILVGGPCANPLTAQVMGASEAWPDCAKDFKEGEAILDLRKNGDKMALIAAGYTADDTRRAAKVLGSVGKGETVVLLAGTKKTVKGTSLEVSSLTVE